jgi:hypothetical protein
MVKSHGMLDMSQKDCPAERFRRLVTGINKSICVCFIITLLDPTISNKDRTCEFARETIVVERQVSYRMKNDKQA